MTATDLENIQCQAEKSFAAYQKIGTKIFIT